MTESIDRAAFDSALLHWHALHARDLPWRDERDPYRILVSEVMLQQTTTQTVKGYYGRFLEAFPDARALAEAREEDVMRLWQGLGYYSRARRLREAARAIIYEHDGCFPDTVEGLLSLPGVGGYTAGAVASMAFDRPALAMDGNVTRALCRLSAETGCVSRADTKKRLHAFGSALLDEACPGEFNQAMMGLGRLICLPRAPKCDGCPVSAFCRARALSLERELPHADPRPEKRAVTRGVALVITDKGILVRKRPNQGLLAGLWEFPGFDGAMDAASVREALEERWINARGGKAVLAYDHVFTHLIWRMTGYAFEADACPVPADARFVTAEELMSLPMPTAMARFRAWAGETLINREGAEA